MFADGTSLFFTHLDIQKSFSMLNQELTSINQWFTAKKFSLNVEKFMLTKFFFFLITFFFQLYCILFIMLIYHDNLPLAMSEADVQRCSVKKVFLEISQNSQENTCARDSFSIKL